MATKTREKLWNRINKLSALRSNAYRRYDLAMDLQIGVRTGHSLAYLMDHGHQWDTLYDVARMQRVSRKAQIAFDVAESMLSESYRTSVRRINEIGLEHIAKQLEQVECLS
jgi:hypothetical protein